MARTEQAEIRFQIELEKISGALHILFIQLLVLSVKISACEPTAPAHGKKRFHLELGLFSANPLFDKEIEHEIENPD